MQPIVHLAVGYLCYAASVRLRRRGRPADTPTAAALVGALLPDLIDKPIWLAGLTDVGRTVGHTLLVAGPLLAVAWWYAAARDRRSLGVAFAIGLGSHLAADVPWHVLAGDYRELGFILWPLTPMAPYAGTKSLAAVSGVEITTLWLEAIVFAAGVALWWVDGRPGIESG